MSRALKKTPAELYCVGESLVGAYNLGSEIAAYCFNRAVWLFGSALQAELDALPPSKSRNETTRKRDEEKGRARILQKWIPSKATDAEPEEKQAKRFADPAKRL
jgi:hypothetical protein